MDNKNFIEITLKIQDSILSNIILKETYAPNINYLINSSLLQRITKQNFQFFNSERDQLLKYQNIQKNGFINITYRKSYHHWGRSYASGALGLCNFRREIRQTLAKDIYTDIDMVNCHFVILCNLLESNNIKCKYLKKYINERDDILNKLINFFLITKDEAKGLFIRLLYFGSFEKWMKDNNIIDNFTEKNEIVTFIYKLQKELIKNCEYLISKNIEVYEAIKKNKETLGQNMDNIKASVCSHILQEFEQRILEKVFIYCRDNGYIKNNNCVLCYDGIMIETIYYKPELLKELEEYIFNELKFKMNFIKKEMEIAYTEEQLIESQIIYEIQPKNTEKNINITLDNLDNFDKTKADILHYFNILDIDRTKDKKDTFNLGSLIFSLNLGYALFFKLCHKNHTEEQLKAVWKKYNKTKHNYNINTLHYWCRLDNLEKHNELQKLYNINNKLNYLIDVNFKVNNKVAFIDDDEPIEKINFESRYLLDQNKLLNDESSLFVQSVLNCKNKTTLIKGPYGIGKTKFLIELIKRNPGTRILLGSYRITLTNDLKGNFDELGFTTYKEDITAPRVIIQVESLLKLSDNINLFMDEFTSEVPYYDIIILDEIEGILNQLHSPTMSGQAEQIYKYLVNLILNCKKLIVLDGDISSRTHNFIKQFGPSTNLYNNIKINKKHFTIINNRQAYLRDIFETLDDNKKIVIVCQGATEGKFIKKLLNEKYPDRVTKFYYGKTSDKDKDKLTDVETEFDEADILIYTSTIEAGVNYDKKRFYKCYGLFVAHTTSQRAFFQMLARVRHFENDNILILAENFKYNEIKLYTFDELKNCLKLFDNNFFDEVKETKDDKLFITKKLNNYGVNFIYNLLEQQNKNKMLFLFYFKLMAEHKGHSIEFILNDKVNKVNKEDLELNKQMKVDKQLIKYTDVLNAKEIKNEEYEHKLKQQEQQNLDEKGKHEIQKYSILKKFGIDYADEFEIMKERIYNLQQTTKYDESNYIDIQFKNIGSSPEYAPQPLEKVLDGFLSGEKLKNFLNMIDIKNYRQETDDKKNLNLEKLKMIKNLLSELGFNNIYDKETKIIKADLENKIELIKNNNIIFKGDTIKTFFNTLSYNNTIFKSLKSFIGFVNSLFSNYGFNIVAGQKKQNNERIYFYSLEFIEYIEEIIHYKLLKGLKMYDTDNIYKFDNKNMKLLHYVDIDTYKINLKNYEDMNANKTEENNYNEEEDKEDNKANKTEEEDKEDNKANKTEENNYNEEEYKEDTYYNINDKEINNNIRLLQTYYNEIKKTGCNDSQCLESIKTQMNIFNISDINLIINNNILSKTINIKPETEEETEEEKERERKEKERKEKERKEEELKIKEYLKKKEEEDKEKELKINENLKRIEEETGIKWVKIKKAEFF